MSFEWRTDEDEGWPEEGKPRQTAVPQPFLRRRWRFLLGVLLSITAVWLALQWQIDQRVETATADIENELLATHNFVLQTAVNQDEDLFRANLSGRDPGWGEVQKTLLNEGLLLGRPMLGWQHQPAVERLTREQVTFTVDPDLRGVELLYPQVYAVTRPDGVTETVTLQQTAVYRQGNTRWLFSPPLEDFWGEWRIQDEGSFSLAYPERDQVVAERLAVDLAALLGQMCLRLADLQCDANLSVQLRLDTDPESLIAINDIETILESGLSLELPTPTLVGLPTDEASYDVLYRAYGVELATAVLAHQTEYDCCRHELFFRALRDFQLAQLGLQHWPLEAAMYGQILSSGFDGNALSHWTRRWEEAPPQFLQVWVVEDQDPIWKQVYMLVEYLAEQETAVSPTEMMRLMNRNSYHRWMRDVLQGNYDQALFPGLFWQHIYEQSQGDQRAELPIPLPDEKITAVCTDSRTGSSHVYAYDLAAHSWAEKLTALDLPLGGFLRTEDGVHFILTETIPDEPLLNNRFYLVTEEGAVLLEETAVMMEAEHFIYYDFLHLGEETKLLRYENHDTEIAYAIRSLDCPTAGCPEVQSAGYVVFSPNGEYFIEIIPGEDDVIQISGGESYETSLVSSADGVRRPLGRTPFVFWLSNDRYGSVEAAEADWVFTTATISNPDRQPLFYESDLLAELDDAADLTLRNVFSHHDASQLIVQAQTVWTESSQENLTYLFRLSLSEDLESVAQVEWLWTGQSAVVGSSPDGRYLVLADFNFASSSSETPYVLFDLETKTVSDPILSRSWFGLEWSADGQWFLQSTEVFLLLHAPAYDYQHFIPFSLGQCDQVAFAAEK